MMIGNGQNSPLGHVDTGMHAPGVNPAALLFSHSHMRGPGVLPPNMISPNAVLPPHNPSSLVGPGIMQGVMKRDHHHHQGHPHHHHLLHVGGPSSGSGGSSSNQGSGGGPGSPTMNAGGLSLGPISVGDDEVHMHHHHHHSHHHGHHSHHHSPPEDEDDSSNSSSGGGGGSKKRR